MSRTRIAALVSTVLALVAAPAQRVAAQDPSTPPPAPAPGAPEPADRPPTAEEKAQALAQIKANLGAIPAGTTATPIGDEATIDAPAGWFFVPRVGTARWLELTENLPDPSLIGVLVREDLETSIYFSFDAIGYVKDDERELDADELMASMREGEVAANAERKQRGFDELELVSWARPPAYNETTRSLEWGTLIRSKGVPDSDVVNFNTRRLGRSGVMSVLLVTDPKKLDIDVAMMNGSMARFAFVSGKDYASFKQGDHTAEIGLGALVVGGGVALAAKVGFFKRSGRSWPSAAPRCWPASASSSAARRPRPPRPLLRR